MKNKKLLIQERSEDFAIEIIKLVSRLPKGSTGFVIGNQIIRSGTSVGANITEAQDAGSKKEFCRSINISLKEARETFYWLNLILKSKLLLPKELKNLISENLIIIKILSKILRTSRSKN